VGFRSVTKSSEFLCIVKRVWLRLCEDALKEEKQNIPVAILLIRELYLHEL